MCVPPNNTAIALRGEAGGKMEPVLLEYLPILLFLGIAIAISLVMVFLPMLIAPDAPDPEKLSAYECGFEAFEDARQKFNVRFYLVSILFIIFDLEIAFFFPYAITLAENGVFGFASISLFVLVLAVGLLYEYRQGALEWE
jgi:NADH-quinone oxidoreductase subunit A